MTTFADTQSTPVVDRRRQPEDKRPWYYPANGYRRARRGRQHRRGIAALALAVAVGGLIGAGTYFVVQHHLSQVRTKQLARTQSAAARPRPPPAQAQNSASQPSAPASSIHLNSETPAGNTGHVGTGGAPVG
jgi:hypothetical protein